MTAEIVEDAGIVSVPVSFDFDGTVNLWLNFWRGVTGVGLSLTAKLPEGTAHGVRIGINDDNDLVFGGILLTDIPLVVEKLQEVANQDGPEIPEHLQDYVEKIKDELPDFLKLQL